MACSTQSQGSWTGHCLLHPVSGLVTWTLKTSCSQSQGVWPRHWKPVAPSLRACDLDTGSLLHPVSGLVTWTLEASCTWCQGLWTGHWKPVALSLRVSDLDTWKPVAPSFRACDLDTENLLNPVSGLVTWTVKACCPQSQSLWTGHWKLVAPSLRACELDTEGLMHLVSRLVYWHCASAFSGKIATVSVDVKHHVYYFKIAKFVISNISAWDFVDLLHIIMQDTEYLSGIHCYPTKGIGIFL